MKTIGLTGGIAAGKSTVAAILKEMGFEVLSADQIAREVVEPGRPAYRKILRIFGPEISMADGRLDRDKLGKIVFADPKRRRQLEQIIHPEVQARLQAVRAALRKRRCAVVFVEVPLLFETGMEKLFDAVWVVAVSPATQLQRLLERERERLTREEAEQRIAAQLPLSEKIARADLVLDNDRNLFQLQEQVDNAIKRVINF
jgi:dephospho-CoA kinase